MCWKEECKTTGFLGSMCMQFQVGKLTEQFMSEVTVGLAAGKQHPFLPDCEGSFQLILQFSRSVAGKESKVAPCFLHSVSPYYLEKSWAKQSFSCFILLWRTSCFLKLHSEFIWMSSCQLLLYLGAAKEKYVPCGDGGGLFLRLRLVCFGNGQKSNFKNCSVRTRHTVLVKSWFCQWFVKGVASDEQEVLPWPMGLLTVSWSVNWRYLLNRDCLFLVNCSSLLCGFLHLCAYLSLDLCTVDPLIKAWW